MAFLGIAPTGTVLPFAGSVAPEGWALCNGSAISRTIYSKLFAVVSTTYGTGDGSSTFNIPDLRGVYPRGAGTNGTANYGGVTGHTPAGGALATKGGQKTAKNGLTATSGTSSLSALTLSGSNTVSGTAAGQTQATSNISLASGAAASGGVDHSHTNGIYRVTADFSNGTTGLIVNGGAATPSSFGTSQATSGASAYAHTHSVSGTTDIAHTHTASALTATSAAPTHVSSTVAASTITVGAGDTETTPAFLTLNYIIKL